MSYRRAKFLAAVIEQMRTWYRWGGREPQTGLDCWGLVAHALRASGGPDLTKWWTDVAWKQLVPVTTEGELLPGDLVFYGGDPADPADVSHVVVHIGEGVVVGANGGGSAIQSTTDAAKAGARVKVKDSIQYEGSQRLRGFRRIPYLHEEAPC